MTAVARTSPIEGLLEYFTLARAAAEGAVLGATRQREVETALAVARQRAEAAETLWSNGHTAEGLRLACASLEGTLDAAALLAPADLATPASSAMPPPSATPNVTTATGAEATTASDDGATGAEPGPADGVAAAEGVAADATSTDAATASPIAEVSVAQPTKPEPIGTARPWTAALAGRRVRPARIERVRQAEVAMQAAVLPVLDADLSPALSELFPRLMAARQIVDDAIAPSAWSTGDLRWTRARRLGTALGVLVAAVMGTYFTVHEPTGTFTSASDIWAQSPSFGPDMAVDGRADTCWLLSDRTTGWLEVRTSPARRVERVILTNTANAPAHDRATQDYRLEIYAHGELVRSVDGHFDWTETPEPVTHEIGLDGVDRVRFVVRSFHRTGAGLAELDVQ